MCKEIRALALASALTLSAAFSARSQTATNASASANDSVVAQPKHGGMFSKMKSLAHNKTAQSIAKGAACAAIPGGQFVVAAINAKQSKSIGDAATSTASAATGGGCLTGIAGLPGLANAGIMGHLTGAAMIGATGAAQPASATGRRVTGSLPAAAPVTTVSTGEAAGSTSTQTEASGQQLQLSGDPLSELSKGKLSIKHVDWVLHTSTVSAPATQSFDDVMTSVGGAVKQSAARYRVNMYVDKHYSDAEARELGAQRIALVIATLQSRGQVGNAVDAGKSQKDKDQRIEIVKVR